MLIAVAAVVAGRPVVETHDREVERKKTMDAGAEFPGLTVETRTAAERFERDTGRWVADEIDERDEKMVRLFLILHGYHPGAEAPGDLTRSPEGRK